MMSQFDEQGDLFLASLTELEISGIDTLAGLNSQHEYLTPPSPSQQSNNNLWPDILYSPNFLNQEYQFVSKGTCGTIIKYTATPVLLTKDYKDRHTIILQDVTRLETGLTTSRLNVLTDNIIAAFYLNPTIRASTPTREGTVGNLLPLKQQVLEESFEILNDSIMAQPSNIEPLVAQPQPKQQQVVPRLIPTLANGKIDLFMIHLWYKLDKIKGLTATFSSWMQQQGITDSVRHIPDPFSPPLNYLRIGPFDPTGKVLREQWEQTYHDHGLNFDNWTTLYEHDLDYSQPGNIRQPLLYNTQKQDMEESSLTQSCSPMATQCSPSADSCGSSTTSPLLPNNQQMAEEIEKSKLANFQETEPSKNSQPNIGSNNSSVTIEPEKPKYHQEQYEYRNAFMEVKQELLARKLIDQTPDLAPELEEILKTWKDDGIFEHKDLPFDHYVLMNTSLASQIEQWPQRLQEAVWQGKVLLNEDLVNKSIASLFDEDQHQISKMMKTVQISAADFRQGGKMAHIFIPSYYYIPPTALRALNLRSTNLKPNTRILLWQKLQQARLEAQQTTTSLDLDQFPSQTPWSLYILDQFTYDNNKQHLWGAAYIQHVEAHSLNLNYIIPANELYDHFLRPLECLLAVDKPMHKLFMDSRYNIRSRNQLIYQLCSIAGIGSEAHRIDIHVAYRNMSYIRHMHSTDLFPNKSHHYSPNQIATPLPLYEDGQPNLKISKQLEDKLNSRIKTIISTQEKFDTIFTGVIPPDDYLKQFEDLEGRFMPMALQKRILDIHNHQKRSQQIGSKDSKKMSWPSPDTKKECSSQEMEDPEVFSEHSGASYSEAIKRHPEKWPVPKRIMNTPEHLTHKFELHAARKSQK